MVNQKALGTSHQSSKRLKRIPKDIELDYVYQLPKFHSIMIHNSKDISKKWFSLSANAHQDVPEIKIHGMQTNLKKLNFSEMEHTLTEHEIYEYITLYYFACTMQCVLPNIKTNGWSVLLHFVVSTAKSWILKYLKKHSFRYISHFVTGKKVLT